MIKKKSRLGKISLFILCGALTVFILMMFLSFNDISEIFGVIMTADVKYVMISISLLVVYMLLTPLTLCMLARAHKTKTSFGNTYVIGMTEHFFNGITPFSTGGQPFQVYGFNKVGVRPAESTGLLLMNFIIMMLVTNAFAIASLTFYSRFAMGNTSMNVIAIVGFTMNFLVLIFMISLATSKNLRKIMLKVFALFAKIKVLKKIIEPRIPTFDSYMENVQIAFKELFKKGWTFAGCILVKSITMALYYAITFYILLSLHIPIGYDQLFYVICGTSFAITMVVFLPTPGSSGGIEFAFKSIFASLAGGSLATTIAYGGMLLWRLLSYYLLMLISLLFYIGFEIYCVRNKSKLATLMKVETDENAMLPMNANEQIANHVHNSDFLGLSQNLAQEELAKAESMAIKECNLNEKSEGNFVCGRKSDERNFPD